MGVTLIKTMTTILHAKNTYIFLGQFKIDHTIMFAIQVARGGFLSGNKVKAET